MTNYKIGWTIIILILLMMLSSEAVPNSYNFGNLVVSYNTTSTQFCTGTYCANVSILNASGGGGSGDITAVNTNGAYLSGGAASGAVSLLVNNTALTTNLSCSSGNIRIGSGCSEDWIRSSSMNSHGELNTQVGVTLIKSGGTLTSNRFCTYAGTNGINCNVLDSSTNWNIAYSAYLANVTNWETDTNESTRVDSITADCAAGKVVQNITDSGLECVTDAGGTDTNESTRFNTLVGDCPASQFLQNISNDGTKVCKAITGASGGTVTSILFSKPWLSGDTITASGTVGFNETRMNDTIDARTTSITYLPINITTEAGTYDAGNITSIQFWDEDTYNVTEDAGAVPVLTVIINFTGVQGVDEIVIRAGYLGSASHQLKIGLWDTGDSAYEEEYGFISDTDGELQVFTASVFDDADHLIGGAGGNVSLRLDHVQTGIASHELYIDYVALIDGTGVIVSSGDTTCDGETCTISNIGTLDGYEATDLLDDTNESTRVGQLWGNITYWDLVFNAWVDNNSNWSTDTNWNSTGWIINWNKTGYISKHNGTNFKAGTGIALSAVTFSVAGGTALTADASGLSVTADAIGDTQLAFNTGQHLTTTSDVTHLSVIVTNITISDLTNNSGWYNCVNSTDDYLITQTRADCLT